MLLVHRARTLCAKAPRLAGTVAAACLALVSPTAGAAVALSLLGFNVLDSVFDSCVGCWTSTYLVVPFVSRPTTA